MNSLQNIIKNQHDVIIICINVYIKHGSRKGTFLYVCIDTEMSNIIYSINNIYNIKA